MTSSPPSHDDTFISKLLGHSNTGTTHRFYAKRIAFGDLVTETHKKSGIYTEADFKEKM